MKLRENDVVLCTVVKIEGTTVFLDMEEGLKGSMVLSEVAAGRIRNLRDYVAPNKKIVCKILKVSDGHVELSLRRVTAKERQYVLEGYEKESALRKILKVLGEDSEKIINKIREEHGILEFFEELRENPKVLEKFVAEEKVLQISKMISEREYKERRVLRRFILKSSSERGVEEIKEILKIEKCDIKYLGASKFSISVSAEDFKRANAKIKSMLDEIAKRSKEKKAVFEILEK